MTDLYVDPILKKYADLITGVVGDGFFKEVYYGDPIRIPASNLPALVLSKDETRVLNTGDGGSNVEDAHLMAITISVITDIRDDINDDKSIRAGVASLYDIIEGRESDTLKLKNKSILHILRNNVLVDSSNGLRTDLGTTTRVDYGLTVGKREVESWAIEAQIEINAHFSQLR